MHIIKTIVIVTIYFFLSAGNSYSQVPMQDIEFDSFILSPLSPQLVILDFKTVSKNKAYLRSIMGWGDWPSDTLTIEGDAKALSNHYKEFKQQEAFAFAVLNKARNQLTGCVYIYPISSNKSTSVRLHLWVDENEIKNNLDMQVLAKILILLPQWGYENVRMPIEKNHNRGRYLATSFGMKQQPTNDWSKRLIFEWKKDE